MDYSKISNIMIIIVSCFLFTTIVTFYVKKIAIYINAMDIPNERKVHKVPMPRLGGLGVFFGFLFGYMFFGTQSLKMNSILIGGFIIILFGVIDDIKSLPAKVKFIGQLITSLIIVFYGNIIIDNITLFNLNFNLGILSYPITIIFILGCINVINLIDGLDGLSAGTCSIFYLTIGIISFIKIGSNNLVLTLTFIMLGSTIGFLYHNFYPAKIFFGDSGSMFQGFMIAIISLLGFKTVSLISFFVPLLILGIPILDTLFAIIRRIINKQPIYLPDKLHLHHQLLKLGLSHKNTVLTIYGMNLLFSFASIIYVLKDKTLGKYIYITIFVLIIWIILRTDIIRRKKR